MEIKRPAQTSQPTKVEDDKRAEVSKIKPLGENQIPDSFETGGARPSENQSQTTSSAEPEKKAGQITGGILTKQMTAARLGESGAKSPGARQATETGGRKDLTPGQQGIADASTNPKLTMDKIPVDPGTAGKIPIRPGAFTGDARSNHEKDKQELSNFLANHGLDSGSGSGSGTTSTGSADGSGINASQLLNQHGVAGTNLGQAINGGPTGPANPFDSLNQRLSDVQGLAKTALDAKQNLRTELLNAGNETGDAKNQYGKDMASLGGSHYPAGIYDLKDRDGTLTVIDKTEKKPNGDSVKTYKETVDLAMGFTDYYEEKIETDKDGNTTTIKTNGTINPDGSSNSKSTGTTVDKNGKVTSTTTTDSKTDKNGNSTTTTITTKDGKKTTTTTTTTTTTAPSASMPDPDAPQPRDPRLLPIDLPRQPRFKGDDSDPVGTPEGISLEDASPSEVALLGKYGMVGQPNQANDASSGGPNIGSDNPLAGGNVDYGPDSTETGWKGPTHTEDPAVSMNSKLKESAKNDEEEDQKSTLQDLLKTKRK